MEDYIQSLDRQIESCCFLSSCLMKTCPDLSLDQNKRCGASSMCNFILKNMNRMTLSRQTPFPVPKLVCKLLAVICSQQHHSDLREKVNCMDDVAGVLGIYSGFLVF